MNGRRARSSSSLRQRCDSKFRKKSNHINFVDIRKKVWNSKSEGREIQVPTV